MTKLNHICFIVPNYPTNKDPVYTFVRELICGIADTGIKCTVIAPQSITNFIYKKDRKRPYHWKDITKKNYEIDIYQPVNAPFLNIKIMKNLNSIGGIITKKTIERTFRKIKITPDVLYAHFWHSGIVAGSIGEKFNIPVIVATGESRIWVQEIYSENYIKRNLKNIKGAICVSTKNKIESEQLGLIPEEKTTVIPNAINNEHFYKKDKMKLREKLGIEKDKFIVSFLGAFSHRKGVLRLSEALKSIPDAKAIYIGKGNQEPNREQAVFIGQLPHNEIVDYLNVSDVFVLPTLAEGCSNAIIEAMACGLPIISSDEPFNHDILDSDNAILIDGKNIEQITKSIQTLRNDKQLRGKMAENSLIKAERLTIKNRVKKIIEFINKMV